MEFPFQIESQQDFDALVIEQLRANEKKQEKKLDELRSDHEKKLVDLTQKRDDLEEKLHKYTQASAEIQAKQLEIDRIKACYKSGLPLELAERLTGASQSELDADARQLANQMEIARQKEQKKQKYLAPKLPDDFYYNPYGDPVSAYFYKKNPDILKAERNKRY